MLRVRTIPTLLIYNHSLVKTVQFGRYTYVGDPVNTVRIFNELEVDELLVLDISAAKYRREPNLKLLRDIADECFMPLGYGGGLHTMEQAINIFQLGFEKVVVNSYAVENPVFITELANHFGSQAVVASIDFKKDIWGHCKVRTNSGNKRIRQHPVEWAVRLEELGAGEILLTSIDREGMWGGFDVNMVGAVSEAIGIPVIAHGGAGALAHIREVVNKGGASAVALGSMVVYQKKGMGILVNFPNEIELSKAIDGCVV